MILSQHVSPHPLPRTSARHWYPAHKGGLPPFCTNLLLHLTHLTYQRRRDGRIRHPFEGRLRPNVGGIQRSLARKIRRERASSRETVSSESIVCGLNRLERIIILRRELHLATPQQFVNWPCFFRCYIALHRLFRKRMQRLC